MQSQRVCHDTLPWLISISLDLVCRNDLLAAALLLSCAACTTPQLTYTGTVVDRRGSPVPHAGLLISSMDERGLEGIIQGWDADAAGNFTFKFPEKVRYITAWSPDSKRKGELDSPPQKDSVIVIR
jgi:hypothetical protein